MGRCLLLRVEDEDQAEYMRTLFKHVTDKLMHCAHDDEQQRRHAASAGAAATAGASTVAVAASSGPPLSAAQIALQSARVAAQAWIVYALYTLHETQPGEKQHISMPEYLWRQLTDCASAFSVLPFRDPALVLHRMISLQMFLFCADYPSTQLDLNGFIAPLDGAGDETHAAEAKLMRKARRSGKLAFIDPMTGKPARLKQSASALQIDELARQRRLLLDSGQAGHLTELSDLSAQIDLDALRTLSSQYSTAVHAALSSSATSSSATTGLEANIAAPASSVSAVPAAAAVPISASASSLRLLQHLQDSLASHAQARATLASKAALSSSSSGGSGGGGGGADPLLHLAAAAVDGASSSTTAAPSLLQFAESLRRPPASSTLHTFPPPPLLSAASSSDRSLQSLEAGSAALHEEEQEEHKAGQVPESHPFLTHEHSQASAAATPLPSMHPSLLSASSSSSNAGASIEFSLASIYAAAANAAVAHPAQQQPR